LRKENARLGKFPDNYDDMLREAKKMKKELRDSIEDARNRLAELETKDIDVKFGNHVDHCRHCDDRLAVVVISSIRSTVMVVVTVVTVLVIVVVALSFLGFRGYP
jgi:hypothetical protein